LGDISIPHGGRCESNIDDQCTLTPRNDVMWLRPFSPKLLSQYTLIVIDDSWASYFWRSRWGTQMNIAAASWESHPPGSASPMELPKPGKLG
jgi:hypothetical protein